MATNKMKAQVPAEGILVRKDYGDAIIYQVVCGCGDSVHDHNLWVEADDHDVTVTLYTTVKSKWWQMTRWKKIWLLLTKGYVEYESSTIMSRQQAINYAETLKLAVSKVKSNNKPV